MMKTFLITLVTIGLAVPAFARMDMGAHKAGQGHTMETCSMCKMDNMDDMGGMMDKCLANAAKIGLTEEQISKIKPVHREMEKDQVRFGADLKIAQIELKEIMEVKDFDLDKASAQVKKIEDLKTTHHLAMLKSMKEVRSILTDEQFKKMGAMMQMKMEGHEQMKMEKHEHHKKMMEKQ
jgi:Spy/CpxP family protein refolding chaperone